MRRCAIVLLASIVWLTRQDRPAAQTHAALELARTSFISVREYVATESIPPQLALPANLVVSDAYRPLVESMMRKSPIFRRQCMRIGAETTLTVRLGLTAEPWPSNIRARTLITRLEGGRLSAVISIAPVRDRIELIAHEFEHIIEQLDGIDLAAMAALPGTGVVAIASEIDVFETTRAARVGRLVRREVGF